MKMKRFIAGLLSLIMVISMTGVVDVNAAETTDSTYGELLAEGLTEGTYTDVSADPNEDYVYTVVGDDGSVAEISTDTTENVVEGYWKVQWDDGTLDVENGEYLIVSWNFENSAISRNDVGCLYGTFTGSKSDVFISADNVTDDLKWNISQSGNGYVIKPVDDDNKYMTITNANLNGDNAADDSKPVTVAEDTDSSTVSDEEVFEIMESYNGTWNGYVANTVFLKQNGGFLNKNGNTYVGTWDQAGDGNCFYLYKKGYRVTDDALAEVTAEVGAVTEYASGWTEYREALLEVYTACDTAAEASAEFEALIAAKDALEIADTKTVYKKYTGALPENGNYLIIADRMTNYALGNTTCSNGNWGLGEIAISEDKITEYVAEQYIWAIKQAGDVYNIQNKGNGKYINIASSGASGLQWSDGAMDVVIAFVSEDNTGTFVIGNANSVYMNCYRQPASGYESMGMGTWSLDEGGYLYLYKETVYVTDLAIAEVESSVTGTEDTYTTTTWNAYQEALAAAKVEFATEEEASAALATLRAAAENLEEIDYSVLETIYEKCKPAFTDDSTITDGVYLIMGARLGYHANNLVKHDFSYQLIDNGDVNATPEDQIKGEYSTHEWQITEAVTSSSAVTCYIHPANDLNQYVYINSTTGDYGTGVKLGDSSVSNKEITIKAGHSNFANSVSIGSGGGWFNYRSGGVGAWTSDGASDEGSAFYLYQKKYTVNTAPIETLVDVSAISGTEAYDTYTAALEAAKEAKETSKEAYEAYQALVDAVNNLSEVILPAEDPASTTDVWVENTSPAGMKATLTLSDGAALAKTSEAIKFDLTTATGFELLASCGSSTGMLMAVVKNSDGTTARAYLVDTYYPGQDELVSKVPVVRDMASPAGGSVEVYGCLVASVVNNRETYSMRSAANTVSTEDIVLAALQELGLDDELSVSDVTVSYMDESSVLNGGMVQGAATYAVSLADTTDTTSTTGDVIVEGCRVYREGNGVTYTAVSDLVTGGNAAFITGSEDGFVLADYQKTGPQNEIYLAQNESLVIGLSEASSDTYEIRVKVNGVESYQTLTFDENYTATITNSDADTMALSIIRKTSTGSEVSTAMFMMSSEQTDTVLARLNAGDILEKLNPFVDVEKAAYYYDAVLWAVKEQITDGWTDTLFAPDMGCTRGQVVTFLWRAAGMPEVTGIENPFTDVTEDAYYCDAVLWAVQNGITDGWTDTLFAPEKECTRGEIVTFLWRAAGEPEAVKEAAAFVDLQANAFYEEAVLWAVENGITEGVDETHFEPENTCLRGQIVTFLYRAMSENK